MLRRSLRREVLPILCDGGKVCDLASSVVCVCVSFFLSSWLCPSLCLSELSSSSSPALMTGVIQQGRCVELLDVALISRPKSKGLLYVIGSVLQELAIRAGLRCSVGSR